MPSGYTGNDSTSPHATHAGGGTNYSYGCVECHYTGIGAEHNNTPKTFQSVFIDTTNSIGDKAGHKNSSADYNATSQSCSNVYCHSNGAPRGSAYVTKAPVWPGNKGTIVNQPNECTSCHEYGSTLTTNAHSRHVVDAGKACSTCHSATVDASGKIIDRSKHANSVKDVAIISQALPGVVVNATYNSTNATCTNSCHRNIARVNGFMVYTTPLIKATWDDSRHGSAAYCGSCHAASPATLAHPVHLVSASGPKLGTACTQCHPSTATSGGTSHVNGTVSVITQTTACAPCHTSPANATWTLASSVTCESCHVTGQSIVPNPGFKSYSAPVKDKFTVSGHGQAGTNYDVSRQCTACHSNNEADAHIGGGPTAKRLTLKVGS